MKLASTPKYITTDTVKGPWFSLGIHVDFQHRYIDLHILWWIVTIGKDWRLPMSAEPAFEITEEPEEIIIDCPDTMSRAELESLIADAISKAAPVVVKAAK